MVLKNIPIEDWTISELSSSIGLNHKDLAFILGISEKNLGRWVKDPRLAEDSHRYQLLKEICIDFRDVIRTDKLGQWLKRSQGDLGNYSPITLMREIQGFKDVLKVFASIRGGAYI